MDPINHLVIISLPKSATVFIQRSVEATLHAKHCLLSKPGAGQQMDAGLLHDFLAEPIATGGYHAPPSSHNLQILSENGLSRIALVVRDPRDAVVSWWRHLERSDIRADLFARDGTLRGGQRSLSYYAMQREDRLAYVIEHMYPILQTWLADWAAAMETRRDFHVHVLRYEDFVLDPAKRLQDLFGFFGHEVTPIVPEREGPPELVSGGVHTHTHFRRGVVGSHKDEIPAHLMPLLEKLTVPAIFRTFDWQL